VGANDVALGEVSCVWATICMFEGVPEVSGFGSETAVRKSAGIVVGSGIELTATTVDGCTLTRPPESSVWRFCGPLIKVAPRTIRMRKWGLAALNFFTNRLTLNFLIFQKQANASNRKPHASTKTLDATLLNMPTRSKGKATSLCHKKKEPEWRPESASNF